MTSYCYRGSSLRAMATEAKKAATTVAADPKRSSRCAGHRRTVWSRTTASSKALGGEGHGRWRPGHHGLPSLPAGFSTVAQGPSISMADTAGGSSLVLQELLFLLPQQLVELKELYDAEQLLSAELGEKLEKTQKDLEDTKSVVNRTSHLQKEISTTQDFTSSIREKWGFYNEETEKNYLEDTTAVDSGRSCLAEVLVECKAKTSISAQQWKNAEDSLFSLGKGNLESVDSIVR